MHALTRHEATPSVRHILNLAFQPETRAVGANKQVCPYPASLCEYLEVHMPGRFHDELSVAGLSNAAAATLATHLRAAAPRDKEALDEDLPWARFKHPV